jgi:hypothetical protein
VSGVYAYCVLPAGVRPPVGLSGLDERSVAAYDIDGLTIWASDADAPPALDLDRVSRHHEVVQAALGEAVVPLRFGGWHPDLAALTDRIRESSSQLAAALRRVRGRVELGIRIVAARVEPDAQVIAPKTGDESSGRAYLRALSRRRSTRLQRRREQSEVARRLQAHLGDMAVEQRVHYLSPPELITVAHLIAREDEPRYRERAAGFARDVQQELVVHVTGPWPPYSFSEP